MRESFGKNFLTFFFEVYAHRNQGWDRWSSFHMKGTNWGPIQLSCECSIVFATQKRILQLNILKYLIELCLAGKTKTFNWSKTIFDMIWCSLKCTKKHLESFQSTNYVNIIFQFTLISIERPAIGYWDLFLKAVPNK